MVYALTEMFVYYHYKTKKNVINTYKITLIHVNIIWQNEKIMHILYTSTNVIDGEIQGGLYEREFV